MKTTVFTCDCCGKQFQQQERIATFRTVVPDGTIVDHDFCTSVCMKEVGIGILNIIDKKGRLWMALQTLWDSLTEKERQAAIDFALKSNTKQEHDDDAEGDEKQA